MLCQRATGWIDLGQLPMRAGTIKGSCNRRGGAAGNVMPDGASLDGDRNGETGLDEAVPAPAEAAPGQSSGGALSAGLPGNHSMEVMEQDDDEAVVSEPGEDSRPNSDLTGQRQTISSGMVSATTALLDRLILCAGRNETIRNMMERVRVITDRSQFTAAVRSWVLMPAGLDWRLLVLYGQKALTAMGERPADDSVERVALAATIAS